MALIKGPKQRREKKKEKEEKLYPEMPFNEGKDLIKWFGQVMVRIKTV